MIAMVMPDTLIEGVKQSTKTKSHHGTKCTQIIIEKKTALTMAENQIDR